MFDPRTKSIADGLFPERSGKTTRVVADLAARDAIAADSKYDGLLVQVLSNRKLYSWDATNATWTTVTGGSGIAKFATLADLQAAVGMTDGDFATTLDTDKLYRYTNSAWVEFVAGGGGGVAKYETIDDILVITNPEECDLAIAKDSGIMMMYKDGSWEVAYNSFTDPKGGGNWELVKKVICTAGVAPTDVFDISGCNMFRIDCVSLAAASAEVALVFDSETSTTNMTQQYTTATGSAIGTAVGSGAGFMLSSTGWPAGGAKCSVEFDKRSKTGFSSLAAFNGGTKLEQRRGLFYTGTQPMNSLKFASTTASFSGYVEVYKWVELAKPLEMATYELVKEYKLTNQVLNDTIPWDGELDDECFITSDFTCATTTNILCVLNNDTTAANYPFTNVYGSGTAASSSAGTTVGLVIGSQGTAGSPANNTARVQLGLNRRRGVTLSNTYGSYFRSYASYWTNTANAVTSMNMNSNGVAITGTVRVYKMVKTRLATTNPNVITTALTYVDANTVQMQPGEIEINGAIMKVTKATNVTLSGNLKSGLTEAASTRYYMYAVRPANGTTPTYVFDTQAPLMDRYGNLAASFDTIDIARAWFHPTLGFMYRYIGYVDNDASSNIKSFNKKALVPTSAANVVTKAVDYAASDGDKVITTATCNITLRNAPNAVITVKSGAAGTVTVLPESGTIDGMTSHKILNQYDSNDYICDGTNWWII